MDSPFRKYTEGDMSTESQKAEIKSRESTYERDKDTSKQPEVYHIEHVDSDKGKLAEMNVEFFNSRLEKYVGEVNEQEAKAAELENKNWFTKVTAWIEKNDVAKKVKILGKTIGGIVGLTAGIVGTGGLLAPALLALGGRAVVDGAIEMYQYTGGGESRLREELKTAQTQRTAQIIKMMKLRRQLQQKDPTIPITSETMVGAETLKDSLKTLVDETENQERIIIERQQEIAKLTEKFAKIRFAAGIATTVATLGYSAIYGVNFGMQNFDVGTKGAEYLKDLYGGVASSSHQVKLYSDGFHFAYSNAEHIANSGIANLAEGRHLIDPLSRMFSPGAVTEYTHKLAGVIPWWKLWASVAGAVGAMGASTYHEYNRIRNSKSQREKIESDVKPVFFSLLKDPRSTYGDMKAEFTTLVSTALGEGSEGKRADMVEKFYKELKPDQIIISKGKITAPGPKQKDVRYIFIKKEGDNIFLAEINKKGKEVDRVIVNQTYFYNTIAINKEAHISAEINTESETTTTATEDDAKWLERKSISAGNKIELGTGVALEDEDGNTIPTDTYEIESVDIAQDEIVIVKKEKVAGKGTKTTKYTISLETLREEMKKNPGSINTYEIKKKGEKGEDEESEWDKLLDELKDTKKFGSEEKKKINNRSIFSYTGDVEDSGGNPLSGPNYIITGVSGNKVYLTEVDGNDKIEKGPTHRGFADKAAFIADAEYERAQAKR